MEWKISDEKLRNAADKSTSVSSKRYKTSIPGVEYRLVIYPNGHNERNRGQVWIFLFTNLRVNKIMVDWTISIKSASYKKSEKLCYSKICNLPDLFNPDKKFIVDGKMTIKLKGTLKAVDLKRKSTSEICTLGEMLSERKDMDFVITVGSEVVKVSLNFSLSISVTYIF